MWERRSATRSRRMRTAHGTARQQSHLHTERRETGYVELFRRRRVLRRCTPGAATKTGQGCAPATGKTLLPPKFLFLWELRSNPATTTCCLMSFQQQARKAQPLRHRPLYSNQGRYFLFGINTSCFVYFESLQRAQKHRSPFPHFILRPAFHSSIRQQHQTTSQAEQSNSKSKFIYRLSRK